MELRSIPKVRFVVAIAVLFSLIGFSLYSRVILYGGFLYDDAEYIVNNPSITGLASTLRLSDPRMIGYVSFAVNYALGGENPFGYLLFNVLVHVMNSVLVFVLIRALLNALNRYEDPPREARFLAFAAALLFLVHPVQTQAVSYITQRFTSLATFFYLLAVWLYIAARERIESIDGGVRSQLLFAGSLLSALLATMTKEISFTIPLILLLFESLVLNASRFAARRYIFSVPFVVVSLLIPLLLLGPEWGLIGHDEGISEITRLGKLYDLASRPSLPYLFTQFRAIVVYIQALLMPVNLRVVYDFPVSYSFFDSNVITSLLFLVVCAGSGCYLWRKGSSPNTGQVDSLLFRAAGAGIFWFFVTLSVESSVIPIKDVIFEHRVYLPSVGFMLTFSALVLHSARVVFSMHAIKVAAGGIVLLVALPLAVGTFVRNDVWADELRLWDDTVRKSPGKAIVYINRGMAYAKRGEYVLALKDLDKAVSMFPKSMHERMKWENADLSPENMARTYTGRGDVQIALGNNEQAREDFHRAQLMEKLHVNVDERLFAAGNYAKRGAYKQAIEEYNKILLGDPLHIEALNDRANAFSYLGRYHDAIGDLTRIIAFDPEFVLAYHNRGIALTWEGQKKRAWEDFESACRRGFSPSCEVIELSGRGEK